MFSKFSTRQLDCFAGLVCFALIGFAVYLQEAKGLEPCLLCTLQRIAFVLMGALFCLGALIRGGKLSTRVIYHRIIAFVGFLGIALAARHVWIQQFPGAGTTACLPDMADLFKLMPFHTALITMMKGGAECTQIVWRFMGLSIATWTLLWFLFLTMIAIGLSKRED